MLTCQLKQVLLTRFIIVVLLPYIEYYYTRNWLHRAAPKEGDMRAAICYEFGKPLVVEEIEIDPPQYGEVKVKLSATAICHSDVHLLRGDWGGRLPVIAGHESAGVIAEVGPGVAGLQPGDTVIVSLLRACGKCRECLNQEPHLCSGSFLLDSQSRFHNHQGQAIHHGINTASFAEYTIVDQTQCVKIPETIPTDSAALLACGVITGIGAVMNTAQVKEGSRAAVIGLGGVGLNVLQGLALCRASQVIAIDVVEKKLEDAYSFGATQAINATSEDPIKAVRAQTDGSGVDYAFVTVGNVSAIEQATKMIRRGGSVIITGIPEISAAVPIKVYPLVTGERRILGSFMGSTNLGRDIPRLVELYQQGSLKLDELISQRYSIDQINEAIAAMEHGEARRNVILF